MANLRKKQRATAAKRAHPYAEENIAETSADSKATSLRAEASQATSEQKEKLKNLLKSLIQALVNQRSNTTLRRNTAGKFSMRIACGRTPRNSDSLTNLDDLISGGEELVSFVTSTTPNRQGIITAEVDLRICTDCRGLRKHKFERDSVTKMYEMMKYHKEVICACTVGANITMECTICLDPYKDPVIRECGHVFCKRCLTESLKAKSKCPQCGSFSDAPYVGSIIL